MTERTVRASESVQPALYMLAALAQARFTDFATGRFYLRAAQRLRPALRRDKAELWLMMRQVDELVAVLDRLCGPEPAPFAGELREAYGEKHEALRVTLGREMRSRVARYFGELEALGIVDPATRVTAGEDDDSGAPAAVAAE